MKKGGWVNGVGNSGYWCGRRKDVVGWSDMGGGGGYVVFGKVIGDMCEFDGGGEVFL